MTYRMKYRPCSFCTLPSKLIWEYTELPHDSFRRDLPTSEHLFGTFKTDRPLTAEELKTFEIEAL